MSRSSNTVREVSYSRAVKHMTELNMFFLPMFLLCIAVVNVMFNNIYDHEMFSKKENGTLTPIRN